MKFIAFEKFPFMTAEFTQQQQQQHMSSSIPTPIAIPLS